MGWTVLYIAFAGVALWLLGEVLLQYKARLRWRLLAFVGFLAVVLGVLLPSIAVIALGAIGFAAGQTLVTLSFRRGFSTGWALGGSPGASKRRRIGGGNQEPTLSVSGIESVEEAESAPGHYARGADPYGHGAADERGYEGDGRGYPAAEASPAPGQPPSAPAYPAHAPGAAHPEQSPEFDGQGGQARGYDDFGYPDPAFPGQGLQESQGYAGPGHESYDRQGYATQGRENHENHDGGPYGDQGYLDPGYADHGYQDHGYQDHGYQDPAGSGAAYAAAGTGAYPPAGYPHDDSYGDGLPGYPPAPYEDPLAASAADPGFSPFGSGAPEYGQPLPQEMPPPPVYRPQPMPDDTGNYGVYGAQAYDAAPGPGGEAYPGYDPQYPPDDAGAAPYGGYQDPYAPDPGSHDSYGGQTYAQPGYEGYGETPPGGVWVPQQRDGEPYGGALPPEEPYPYGPDGGYEGQYRY